MSRISFLTICLIGLSLLSYAQNSQDSIKSQVETIDGNAYIGIILEQTPEIIRIKTDKLGEISIPRSEVKRINQLSTEKLKTEITGSKIPSQPDISGHQMVTV